MAVSRYVMYAGGNGRGALIGHPDPVHVRPDEIYPVGDGEGKVFPFAEAHRLVEAGSMKWVNEEGADTKPRFNTEEQAIITKQEQEAAAVPPPTPMSNLIPRPDPKTGEEPPNTLKGTGLAQNESTVNLPSSTERASTPAAESSVTEPPKAAGAPETAETDQGPEGTPQSAGSGTEAGSTDTGGDTGPAQ